MDTMRVQAWCDQDLYCWSWFAIRCGTNNYLTLMEFSPLFTDVLTGSFSLSLPVPYRLFRTSATRHMTYFLVNGIYLEWKIVVRPIYDAPTPGKIAYSKRQEATRKDIERFFCVMKSRFRILQMKSEFWDQQDIVATTKVCTVIQNLLVRMAQSGFFAAEIRD